MRPMRREIFLVTTILCASLALPAVAQPPAEEPNELIVLLRASEDAPGPEEVVRAINVAQSPRRKR